MLLKLYTAQDYAADEYASLEARARRCRKTRRPLCHKNSLARWVDRHFGKFQLINPRTNMILAGERFELGPEAVIDFCENMAIAEV